jgi:hypothetical protein
LKQQQLVIESNRAKPYILELFDAIQTKQESRLIELIAKFGLEFGFFNKKIESLISQKPILIGKIIVNHYLKQQIDSCQTIRSSKLIPQNLEKFKHLSKKEVEAHNRVESIIKSLNPNYTPNIIEEEVQLSKAAIEAHNQIKSIIQALQNKK